MQQQNHPIATEDNVAQYQLTSFHFGAPGRGKKVYIQASLHADEVPPMLVAHVLRRELDAARRPAHLEGLEGLLLQGEGADRPPRSEKRRGPGSPGISPRSADRSGGSRPGTGDRSCPPCGQNTG